MQTHETYHTSNLPALAAVSTAITAAGEIPLSANPEPLPNPNVTTPAAPAQEPTPSTPTPGSSTKYVRRRRELLREFSLVRVETELPASVLAELDRIARCHGQSRSAYLNRILQSHVRRHSEKY